MIFAIFILSNFCSYLFFPCFLSFSSPPPFGTPPFSPAPAFTSPSRPQGKVPGPPGENNPTPVLEEGPAAEVPSPQAGIQVDPDIPPVPVINDVSGGSRSSTSSSSSSSSATSNSGSETSNEG